MKDKKNSKLALFFLATKKEVKKDLVSRALENYFKNLNSTKTVDVFIALDYLLHRNSNFMASLKNFAKNQDNINNIYFIASGDHPKRNIYIQTNISISLKEYPMGRSHGINYLFYATLNELFKKPYENYLLLETDTKPMKNDWLDVVYDFCDKDFCIAGSIYKGLNKDEVYKQYYGYHLNGVAIYKNSLETKSILNGSCELLKKELLSDVGKKKYNNFMNYDVAIYLYCKQNENYLKRCVDTDFITNCSSGINKDYSLEKIMEEYPETRILHKKNLY